MVSWNRVVLYASHVNNVLNRLSMEKRGDR